MRLATAWTPGGQPRLYVSGSGALYFDLVAAARGESLERLRGVYDVGSLCRAGDPAWTAVRSVLATIDQHAPGVPLEELRLAPPVLEPREIVCVGRNYAEHITESNVDRPPAPVLFAKFPNALIGDRQGVVLHALTTQLDYEGELAVIIGRRASKVTADRALAYVAGYTAINDISARDLQLGDVQWIRGKSLDTFAPIGPIVMTSDEAPDIAGLTITTRVNGELRQQAACSEMLFDVPTLLEFITQAITLQPGDIVATGTPAGTGFGFDPPRYLAIGDLVEVSIDGIGTLTSTIVAPQPGADPGRHGG